MKVAIITDTHYGARKGSKLFHDYFEQFYKNIFFPTLEEQKITTVIHMGDAFDSRKSIDYQSLEWAKRVVFDPLLHGNYDVHMIIGNHDSYYKNTNNINSPQLLLKSYSNIKTYSSPIEIKIDDLNILMLPWICSENEKESIKIIQKTKCKIVLGHLELNGFLAYKGHTMEDGMDFRLFDKFDRVFSGHYHTRSNNGKIFYLGNPYEIYWNDVNDVRGFTIFDTDTLEHTVVNNPYKMFKIIYYEDTPYQTFDVTEYENKIVKIIVRKKTNQKQFEKFVDKLYSSNVSELKVVENFQLESSESFEAFESEDTLSILNRYIEESEINLDKSMVKKIIKEIYQESCELV
jgi:DNA repair exonuclease SbcCD nuclease subunit